MSCPAATARTPVTPTKAAPSAAGDLGVELLGDDAADVVGLDDVGKVDHL